MACQASPTDSRQRVWDTRKRLEKCWTKDLKWELYPFELKEVSPELCLYVFPTQSISCML